MAFNLLATTYRRAEAGLIRELGELLRAKGDPQPLLQRTVVQGLVTIATQLPSRIVVNFVREIVVREPWRLRFVLRLMPIDNVAPTELSELAAIAAKYAEGILPKDTFRVTVERRKTELSSQAIIEAVAAQVPRAVNLDHPDWVVLVEVIGPVTGMALLRPSDILSIQRLKRGEAD